MRFMIGPTDFVFDGEDVVAAAADDVFGGVALTVHGVGRDDHPVDVECGEKLSQHGDFVGLDVDRQLREHDAAVLAQPGQKVHEVAGRAAGTS